MSMMMMAMPMPKRIVNPQARRELSGRACCNVQRRLALDPVHDPSKIDGLGCHELNTLQMLLVALATCYVS